jgi:hypothetical protein
MRHRGHKKAVIDVAYAMLVRIYDLQTLHTTYPDLGDDSCARRHSDHAGRRAVERQGYRVTIESAA